MNLSEITVTEWNDLMRQVEYVSKTIAGWYGLPKWSVYEYAKDCAIKLVSKYRKPSTIDLRTYVRAFLTHKTVYMVKREMKRGLISRDGDINQQTGKVDELVCPELTVEPEIIKMEREAEEAEEAERKERNKWKIDFAFRNSNDVEKDIMCGIMAGLTCGEIAEKIGKTKKAVEKTVERLRARFKNTP